MLRYRFSLPLLMASRVVRTLVPAKAGFRILLFHDVPKSAFPEFERFIAHVKDSHGLLSPAKAAAWIAGEVPQTPDPARVPCLLSFDDGFASNFDLAGSVLAVHGARALFFVSPGLIDLTGDNQRQAIAKNVFDGRRPPEDLDPALVMMDWEQIRELVDLGHEVGCHGLTHRRLSNLDGDDLRREILVAGDLLETRLDRNSPWYAYAFGDVGSVSEPALKIIAERFRFCRSGIRGLNTEKTTGTAIVADHIPLLAPLAYQKFILEGGLDSRYAGPRRELRRMTKF